MSVNNIGPNIGGSSLLASYLEKQSAASTLQAPQVQSPVQHTVSFPQASLRTFSEQTATLQNRVAQAPVAAPVVQNPTVQATEAAPVVQVENDTEKPADNTEKPVDEARKPSFIARAKEFFKNPESKKIIIGGIVAAVAIAGITAFALLSHKKPKPSPELEEALWGFVNTVGDIFGQRK